MRVGFTADEVGFDDEYALVCGVAGEGKSLVFQRHKDDGKDDWGIHLGFCDQSQGDYDSIARCRVRPTELSVDLAKPLGNLKSVTGFDVVLRITAEEYAALRRNLQTIFRGSLHLLTAD